MVSVTAFILWLLAMAMPVAAHAGSARMELDIAPGVTAEADYWPGEADMPAVLILHGFLQTGAFPTVRRLAESLAEEGFSVLTPSLTLGLNRRRQSLACEAIHTHSMQQDVAELAAWTDWLAERAGKPPVLIGHSSGGVQLVAMLESNPGLGVDRALLVSLSSFGEGRSPEQIGLVERRARADLGRHFNGMNAYALAYCNRYVTNPKSLLSYLEWDRARLAQALVSGLAPVALIYGDRDGLLDKAWLDTLQAGGVTIRPVPGAHHFFDLANEFDLSDEVAQLIAGSGHG